MRAPILLRQALSLANAISMGVQIGAVRRPEAQLGARLLDGVLDAGNTVGGKVVQHHDVTGPECGDQQPFDPGPEGRAIHGAVQHHGRHHPVHPQGSNERRRLPVPVRDRCPAAFPARGAP